MAMQQPTRPTFYYDFRTLSLKRQRVGTTIAHPPIIHPFQRNQVRHMSAMVKGGDPTAPFCISEEELAGGLGWSVRTETGPKKVGGDDSCGVACCSYVAYLKHLKEGEHQLNEDYTWSGMYSPTTGYYAEARDGGNPLDDSTHEDYMNNVAAAGNTGADAEELAKAEVARVLVAYRDYVNGTHLDLSKGSTLNLFREQYFPSIRDDQSNSCYVLVGTREVHATNDDGTAAEAAAGTRTLPLLRKLTAKDVQGDDALREVLDCIRKGEEAPANAGGFHQDITAIVCDFTTVAQVRKMPSWPRSWANFSLYSCIPTGMHGPPCIF